jgi:alpha-glucosidase
MNTSENWWKEGIIYQIYPRSFCDSNGDGIGDLPGIARKLDYLQDLGIDGIWLSPVNTSPMFDFGYDVSDYRGIDPVFGTMKDFERLIAESHKRNIRVIMDMVINHTSHLHPWFRESRSSRENPRRDWYMWHDGRNGKPPNNWYGFFGGRAWEWDAATRQFYYHSFLKEQPDLNWRNANLRKAVLGEIRFWFDKGVDGFRFDVANYYIKDRMLRSNPIAPGRYPRPWDWQRHIYDRDRPETHDVLKELRALADSYRDRMLVGEIFTYESADVSASYLGDGTDELHLAFDFSLIHAKGWDARTFSELTGRWINAIPPGGWPCNVLSNHDEPRIATRIGGGIHNGARARVALAFLLTIKGTPFLYYGEEIGMKNGVIARRALKDPVGLRYWPFDKGRDPMRTPMQWSAAVNAGFTNGTPWLPVNGDHEYVNVERQREEKNSILNFSRALISLRKKTPALRLGEWIPVRSTGDMMAYVRSHESGKVMVLLNFSRKRQRTDLAQNATGTVIFSTHLVTGENADMRRHTLSPHEVTIVALRQGDDERHPLVPSMALLSNAFMI